LEIEAMEPLWKAKYRERIDVEGSGVSTEIWGRRKKLLPNQGIGILLGLLTRA
jgi:hypothetical protein